MALAMPAPIAICLLLAAIDPSKGSLMYSGSMTAPGIRLGVEAKPAIAGPTSTSPRHVVL